MGCHSQDEAVNDGDFLLAAIWLLFLPALKKQAAMNIA